ncbi:hypothetical protein J2Z21_004966 [Streptomyces griseochromogenes]|uniref:Uncharacterized protein n=1 Tax=Streptomyces griseochromogenes TaxID=68214 RepID=A0A1B1ASN5_9ACTN|nr:DUF6177 family protein [Streptomyces griseochromogenes]ANP49565.1 hypothetical protein AVL59_08065 [Streptomyces griseochromogenes]MBP2051989.1 hypothetical protein [Streptomyces griseochromogenes]
MTKDVIALTPKMPDTRSLLTGLYAGGPELNLTATDDGAVIQLTTAAGLPLVSVEAPVLVHVPGEAERLLGPQPAVPEPPFWWTEARASTAVPEAESLAGSVCGRLTMLLGGTTWPPEAAHTAHVTVPDDSAEANVSAPSSILPAVDVLTDSTAVVLADRPVVPLTAWLSDILRITAQANRALHLVTPPHVRLTLPLRTALGGAPNRWVIQDPAGGYYDGLSGVRLAWREGTFTPAAATAFTATATPAGQRQLTVSFRTVHEAAADLVIGRGLEAAWRHLTGAPPAGWSTAEPVNLPWSTRRLTDLARDRAPAPTHLVVIGAPHHPAIATHRITRTTAGVAEDTVLTLGHADPADVPLGTLDSLAALLVEEHGLTTMLTTLRHARADLTLPAHLEAPPLPVSFTLGPRDVRTIGLAHARRPPLAANPRQLGSPANPALHYPLGDGTDAEAWTALRILSDHLRNGSEA